MANPATSRRNTLVGVGAGVVGGAALLGLVAMNMHPGAPAVVTTPTIATSTPVASATTFVPTETPTVTVASPATVAAPSATPTSDDDVSESASPSPKPTKRPSASPSSSRTPEPDASGAVVTSLERGSYVTVFRWMSKRTTTAAEAAAYAESQAGKGGHNPIAFDGDAVPGMNPGFWGIGVPGASSFGESRQVCVQMGFAPNGSKCWARLVK